MVYNETGQIIRTGTFADITAHLSEIKEKYQISAVYILGTQKRGSNREDWAPEAQSPSPFAPMSMTELEPGLGGEEALKSWSPRLTGSIFGLSSMLFPTSTATQKNSETSTRFAVTMTRAI